MSWQVTRRVSHRTLSHMKHSFKGKPLYKTLTIGQILGGKKCTLHGPAWAKCRSAFLIVVGLVDSLHRDTAADSRDGSGEQLESNWDSRDENSSSKVGRYMAPTSCFHWRHLFYRVFDFFESSPQTLLQVTSEEVSPHLCASKFPICKFAVSVNGCNGGTRKH